MSSRLSVLGKSALHWAAAVNNVEATLVLLKNGANRDMQDNKVRGCFHLEGFMLDTQKEFSLKMNQVKTKATLTKYSNYKFIF